MYIYKTPAGTWAFRVDIGIDPRSGKRRQKSRQGFQRKKDAEAAALELQSQIRRQTYVLDSPLTFEQFAKEWLQRYKLTVKTSTYKSRVPDVFALISRLGKVPLQKITLREYQAAITELSKHYAPSTLRLVHNTAQMIFRDARRYENIIKDPTEFARLPKAPDGVATKLPAFLDRSQLEQFLAEAKASRPEQDYAMFVLLAYTGLRIGEAMALTWEDVDFSQRQITISKNLYFAGREPVVTSPKTRRSNRVVDVSCTVIDALKRHRKAQVEARLAAGKLWKGNYVFTSPTAPGRPTKRQYWGSHIKAVLKRCPGLPPIHPHSFRHTHASLLAEAGVSLQEIADRLGHTADGVTRKIYLHVTRGRRKEVAEQFARFMER
ncbi:site-specific integrase [Acidaminococcus timonensis]|uniref:site-specific integrase n=1 Tax=Acidaminococcus timonensis TaxID=1871002 RepID=UPI00307AD849